MPDARWSPVSSQSAPLTRVVMGVMRVGSRESALVPCRQSLAIGDAPLDLVQKALLLGVVVLLGDQPVFQQLPQPLQL